MRRLHIICGLVFGLAFGLAASNARAEDETSSSYLTPFPENDSYRLAVFGDGPSDGLVSALREGLPPGSRVDVQGKRWSIAGFTRPEFEEELKNLGDAVSRERIHIAVVYTGANDRQSMRVNGRWYKLSSDEWRVEYGRRVDLYVKLLKKKRIGIYWLGVPILKSPLASDEMQNINTIVRERSYLSSSKFIDTWTAFADQSGQYSAYGPDLAGKVRQLREGEGAWFTQAGYQKLAHFAEIEIKRDIAAARTERNLPLAGNETEQKRISLANGTTGPAKANGLRNGAAGGGSLEQPADNSKVVLKTLIPGNAISGPREEVQQLDIVRPMIPAAVIAHVARNERPTKSQPVGELIASDLDGGLTMLSAISAVGQDSPALRRSDALVQSSYLKAIIKGEALTPKPGRADDFAWPRPVPAEPRS